MVTFLSPILINGIESMFENKNKYPTGDDSTQPLHNPVTLETLQSARTYRLQRVRDQLLARDCAAILEHAGVDLAQLRSLRVGVCQWARDPVGVPQLRTPA
jgi:hypothetical protein